MGRHRLLPALAQNSMRKNAISSIMPAFTKLGAKLATPSWMSTGGDQLMYPRAFHNGAYRAILTGLPASEYSVLYSTDHATATGKIGRVDFDDIEGDWTDSGGAIHSADNQRETPHPVYAAADSRVNVYVSDDVSGGTNNDQHTLRMTSTTLGSLSSAVDAMTYGQHDGYAQVVYDAGATLWKAWHLMAGGESAFSGYSTSADGNTFILSKIIVPGQQHIAGEGKLLDGVPYYFKYRNQWYGLGALNTRPRASNSPSAIVAWPVETATWRPIGGYFTLVTPGSSSDPDKAIKGYYDIIVTGGLLYLLYIGVDNSGTQSICVAKSTGSAATQTAPIYAVNGDGTLKRGATQAVNDVYDATGTSDLPAFITKVSQAGSDNSSHVNNSYYELKTGSGSAQTIYLRSTATYDPTDYETLEMTLRGLTFKVTSVTEAQLSIQIGFVDDLSNIDGALVLWSPSVDTRGLYRAYTNNVAAHATSAYLAPWLDTSGSVSEWARTQAWDITLRLHNNATRLSVLLNDQVAFHRDISGDGITWGSGSVFGYFRISNFTTFPQIYARFTSLEVKAWT